MFDLPPFLGARNTGSVAEEKGQEERITTQDVIPPMPSISLNPTREPAPGRGAAPLTMAAGRRTFGWIAVGPMFVG